MKKTALVLAAVFGMSSAGLAMAQALDFNAVDADQNGQVTYEELVAAIPDFDQDRFNALDVNGDGVLTPDEFAAVENEVAPAPAL